CQPGFPENHGGGYRDGWHHPRVMAGWKPAGIDRVEPVANARCISGPAVDGDRPTGAKAQAGLREPLRRPADAPEPVEREQGGCRVRATAPEARPHGNALANGDVDARPYAACRGQQARGAQAELVVGVDAGQGRRHLDAAVVAAPEIELVGEVDQLEDRLEFVVAIVAPTGDMEIKVELGRRRAVMQEGRQVHGLSTTIRTWISRAPTRGLAGHSASRMRGRPSWNSLATRIRQSEPGVCGSVARAPSQAGSSCTGRRQPSACSRRFSALSASSTL